ncbi:metal-dependent transcriptional regulator [Facklamia miroungae]|uniref:Manganese transport regulator n=1 Tax=Facklamia miroungae TaxID=120956 RepID=A0A1G7QI38_9LACT|nr:metal-dependent transcriptional regulator [Facklamia miroungae]NKZ28948.1 metal-dependent transcriptional regulator [Facklamia miroungae]SDF98128.1 DtxR family transcriptional regulator, Mn-dependent transcriptional regulator [Facklamia miroungae]
MKRSNVKENYLKAIFSLNGSEEYVSNKLIAESLNISAPSVTDMIGRLVDEKLVESIPYKGVRLTKTGLESAIRVVSKHRITELFLLEVLKYDITQVHKDAETIEHLDSEYFFKKLEELLDYPKFCPHGSIIPTLDNYQEVYRTPLTEYEEGDTLVFRRCIDKPELLDYLQQINLHLNQTIKLTKIDSTNRIFIFSYQDDETGYFSFDMAQLVFFEKA